MERKIITVITAATGDRVEVTSEALEKAVDHLEVPSSVALELLALVLKDPTDIFLERTSERRNHYLYYRYQDERYLVAVVKKIEQSAFLCTMYLTGRRIRNKHKRLERIR